MTIRERIYNMLLESQQYLSIGRPSLQEIADRVGLKSKSTVHYHLKQMRQSGLVTWFDGSSRTVRVLTQCSLENHHAQLDSTL